MQIALFIVYPHEQIGVLRIPNKVFFIICIFSRSVQPFPQDFSNYKASRVLVMLTCIQSISAFCPYNIYVEYTIYISVLGRDGYLAIMNPCEEHSFSFPRVRS